MNSVLRQTMRLSLSAEQPSQERRECPFRQERDVLTRHLQGESFAGGSGRRLSARQGGQSIRVRFKHAQQPDHRGSGPDGSCLVLCEGARASTQKLPGFYLGEPKSLPDGTDLVGLKGQVRRFHALPQLVYDSLV